MMVDARMCIVSWRPVMKMIPFPSFFGLLALHSLDRNQYSEQQQGYQSSIPFCILLMGTVPPNHRTIDNNYPSQLGA
jgi:hypothetical protein